jgi:hypothetical protein
LGVQFRLYDGWNPAWENQGSMGVPPELSKIYLWGLDISDTLTEAGGLDASLSVLEMSNSQITSNPRSPS